MDSPRVTRRTTASVVAPRAATRRTARQSHAGSGGRAVSATSAPVAAPRSTTRSEEDRLEIQREDESIEIHADDDDLIEMHEDAQVLIMAEQAPQPRPLTSLVVIRHPPVPAPVRVFLQQWRMTSR